MRAVGVFFLALYVAAPVLADIETAIFFLSRAKSALRAGRLDEAAKYIDRSLSEEAGFLPALVVSA